MFASTVVVISLQQKAKQVTYDSNEFKLANKKIFFHKIEMNTNEFPIRSGVANMYYSATKSNGGRCRHDSYVEQFFHLKNPPFTYPFRKTGDECAYKKTDNKFSYLLNQYLPINFFNYINVPHKVPQMHSFLLFSYIDINEN